MTLADRVELRRQQIYDLAHDNEIFELVFFMGVLYHLRYPLLGLDIVAQKTQRLRVFHALIRSMLRRQHHPDDGAGTLEALRERSGLSPDRSGQTVDFVSEEVFGKIPGTERLYPQPMCSAAD